MPFASGRVLPTLRRRHVCGSSRTVAWCDRPCRRGGPLDRRPDQALPADGPIVRLAHGRPDRAVEQERVWPARGGNDRRLPAVRGWRWFLRLLVRDYARMYGGPSVPDNAQNWYRHQLTEFGVVGSLGWIAWVLLFAGFVLRRRSQNRSPPGVRVARGMLLAVAIVSLVGMPGQAITMVITFWTVAFWFVSLIGAPPSAAPPRTRTWALVVVVLLAYVAGTAHLAATSLRASARAQRAGRAYTYGLYAPEPGEAGSEQRWTRRRSAIVLDASGSWTAYRSARTTLPSSRGRSTSRCD